VGATIREVREHHGGGYVEGAIRWLGDADVIHPCLGAYTALADLVRGEHERVVEDFYGYLLHSSATHAFCLGTHYPRREALHGYLPYPTGAANYALLLRHMLVHEEGEDLHLLAAVPDGWLAEGLQICIQRLPTHFGELGFSLRGMPAGVDIAFEKPKRQPPASIKLHLPASRPPLSPLPGVEVVWRTGQKRRWDFEAVKERYRRSAAGEEGSTPRQAHPGTGDVPAGRGAGKMTAPHP
jgi:hypothetical protein